MKPPKQEKKKATYGELLELNQRLLLARDVLLQREKLAAEGVGYKWLCLFLFLALGVASALTVPDRDAVIKYVETVPMQAQKGKLFETLFTPEQWARGTVGRYKSYEVVSVAYVRRPLGEDWALVGVWGNFLPVKAVYMASTCFICLMLILVQFMALFVGKTRAAKHFTLQRRWWEAPWTVPLGLFRLQGPMQTFSAVVAVHNATYELELDSDAIILGVVQSYVVVGLVGVAASMLMHKSMNNVVAAPACVIALLTSHALHTTNSYSVDISTTPSLNTPLVKLLIYVGIVVTSADSVIDLFPHACSMVTTCVAWIVIRNELVT